MTYPFPPDVQKLLEEQMTALGTLSEDDVLREALHALRQFAHTREEAQDEYRQTVDAVRDGLADMQAGRMQSLDELIGQARSQAQS